MYESTRANVQEQKKVKRKREHSNLKKKIEIIRENREMRNDNRWMIKSWANSNNDNENGSCSFGWFQQHAFQQVFVVWIIPNWSRNIFLNFCRHKFLSKAHFIWWIHCGLYSYEIIMAVYFRSIVKKRILGTFYFWWHSQFVIHSFNFFLALFLHLLFHISPNFRKFCEHV